MIYLYTAGALPHEIRNELLDSFKWDVGQRILVADISHLTKRYMRLSTLVSDSYSCSQGANCLILVACELSYKLLSDTLFFDTSYFRFVMG